MSVSEQVDALQKRAADLKSSADQARHETNEQIKARIDDPGGLFAFYGASWSSRQARWLVRVRSSGWPFHQASSRIKLRATAA